MEKVGIEAVPAYILSTYVYMLCAIKDELAGGFCEVIVSWKWATYSHGSSYYRDHLDRKGQLQPATTFW